MSSAWQGRIWPPYTASALPLIDAWDRLNGTCCEQAYEFSSERYVACPECGTVVRNIDGLHKPPVIEGLLW